MQLMQQATRANMKEVCLQLL